MGKQTALDWFIYQITQKNMLAIDAISLAKEIHKQEIIDAYTFGQKSIIEIVKLKLQHTDKTKEELFVKTKDELEKLINDNDDTEDAEQYYNETFKK
jgi:hypothetical protein